MLKKIILLLLLLIGKGINAQTGITWSPATEIATDSYGNGHPRIAIDGSGNPLVIWGKNNSKQVFFTRWTGSSFSIPIPLNPPSIPIFAASWAGPDMAAHGDTVYVVFKETPEHTGGVYIACSQDGGATFLDIERVDNVADSLARFPSVATNQDGQPLVAFMKFNPGWENPRHVLAKSLDYGQTFTKDVLGSGFSGGIACDCCPSSVISSENTTALLYRDNLNNLRNNWAGISLDGGNTFGNGIEIDNTNWNVNICPSSGPDGVIIGDKLYSVFMSAASGAARCYRSQSAISTMQIENIAALTGNTPNLGQQNYPRIAASGNAAAIAWVQASANDQQLAFQFTPNISLGFPSTYDTLATENVENVDIAIASDGTVHVVWEDYANGTVQYRMGKFTLSSTETPFVQEKASFQVYPNPANASSRLQLQFRSATTSLFRYQIYSVQGQSLLSSSGTMSKNSFDIDVSSLQTGQYFITIEQDNQVHTEAFVVK